MGCGCCGHKYPRPPRTNSVPRGAGVGVYQRTWSKARPAIRGVVKPPATPSVPESPPAADTNEPKEA